MPALEVTMQHAGSPEGSLEMDELVVDLATCTKDDIARVGGKNASLGEMIGALTSRGIKVPPGFAVTAAAYRAFIEFNDLRDWIGWTLTQLEAEEISIAEAGASIRKMIRQGRWPPSLEGAILESYQKLADNAGSASPAVAVRSSATAEDLPEASFAGQQESFLNVRGSAKLLEACKLCLASLFTDRAIAYRIAHGFEHGKVALSIGVQAMVRSDKGAAGVAFTIDTESGFDQAVLINGAYGLGESVVKGSVDPDEFMVFKPLLDVEGKVPIIRRKIGGKKHRLVYGTGDEATVSRQTRLADRKKAVLEDAEILQLARQACLIEEHYRRPMDIEWAKDGISGEIYVVQARPETVQSRKRHAVLSRYSMSGEGKILAEGVSVGNRILNGSVCRIEDTKDIASFKSGSVLVAKTTDPDWVPLMKKAAGIVTDHGGRTSHAAIVARELGIPAVLGTGNATKVLRDGQQITLACAEGNAGFVHEGHAEIETRQIDLATIPKTRTKVMLNLADPSSALSWHQLPADGVGLARLEFILANTIGIHPLAALHPDRVQSSKTRREILKITEGYDCPADFYSERLALALAQLAAGVFPGRIIVRTSDFKSNEYAHLLGGSEYEEDEANPMMGWRGASRYCSEDFREAFDLECKAIRKAREVIGFTNIDVMIPFCRTLEEAERVLEILAINGLEHGGPDLRVFVMCEIPSNVVLSEQFAELFDGLSIGSNDLTQLTLGIDRDSEKLAYLFDESDASVRWMIRYAIEGAHSAGKTVGLCGEAPSKNPAFAEFLVECGIDTISVSPEAFVDVKKHIMQAEARAGRSR